METNPTIVRLSPSDGSGITAVSFEEAFGDFSNLKGRGRKRRAAKKATKQADRQQKRMTRITNRQQRKVTRKVGRQDIRGQKQQAKMANKINKATARQELRIIRNPEPLPEEQIQEEAGYEEQSSQPISDSQSNDSGNYNQSSQPQYDEQSDDSGYYEEQGGVDQGYDDEGYDDEESGYEEEEGDAGEYEFSGEGTSEFEASSMPQKRLHPKAMELGRQIEVNAYIIHCLNNRLGKGGNDQAILGEIEARHKKMEELNNLVEAYSNARGGRGSSGNASAKKEVRAARKEAKKELKAAVKAKKVETKAAKQMGRQDKKAAKVAAKAGGKAAPIPVDEELNAEVSDEKIEVPAETEASEFNGTGLIAIDEEGDFDAPETRAIEFKSNFSGISVNKIPWKGIIITGLVIGGIYFISKKLAKAK